MRWEKRRSSESFDDNKARMLSWVLAVQVESVNIRNHWTLVGNIVNLSSRPQNVSFQQENLEQKLFKFKCDELNEDRWRISSESNRFEAEQHFSEPNNFEKKSRVESMTHFSLLVRIVFISFATWPNIFFESNWSRRFKWETWLWEERRKECLGESWTVLNLRKP